MSISVLIDIVKNQFTVMLGSLTTEDTALHYCAADTVYAQKQIHLRILTTSRAVVDKLFTRKENVVVEGP